MVGEHTPGRAGSQGQQHGYEMKHHMKTKDAALSKSKIIYGRAPADGSKRRFAGVCGEAGFCPFHKTIAANIIGAVGFVKCGQS